VSVQLRYRAPYDWPAMLAYLRARAISGVETVTGDTYARTIDVDGSHGLVRVRPGTGDALEVTVRSARLAVLPAVIARLRRVFVVAARPGLRVPGAWDGFELAARAVLGQQIAVTAAVRLAARLVAQYGEPLSPEVSGVEGLTHVFPSAPRLGSFSPAMLPMPRARASAIVSLAKAVAADPHLFRIGRSLEDVVAQLRAFEGIGAWTAHYIAMRECREPDAFPPGDVGLLRAMTGPDGRRPTQAELLARAERWRPWRAYAAQHLWMADAVRSRAPQSVAGRA
jgi:AraC family transcriptional regulator of adaptative response / DNA-3-methyladenine glycosylase II